jgi:predicted GNAT family acetyltransferase
VDLIPTSVATCDGSTVAMPFSTRGHGAALTAAMTRRLLSKHDVVALGVLTGNGVADRLYRGLGFTGSIPRTSLEVA